MKKIATLSLFSILFIFLNLPASAQDTTVKKNVFENLLKKSDSVKFYSDSLKKVAKTTAVKASESNTKTYDTTSTLSLIIVIAFFFIMALLLFKFFKHLKDNSQRIGYQSIKLIGLILIFPGVCILAVGAKGILSGETLAALFGTIAGYVLSREDDNKDTTLKDVAKKKEEELQGKIRELEEQIKTIKQKNPNLIP